MDWTVLASVCTFFVLYTGLLFGAIAWMFSAKINPIKELLSNHITETNKNIETLTINTNKKFDDLNKKFDDLNKRFDDVYKILLDIKSEKNKL